MSDELAARRARAAHRQRASDLVDRAIAAMQERGITSPEQLLADAASSASETILEACRWYDEQNGRVGAGVLVNEIRARVQRPTSGVGRPTPLDAQSAYQDQIISWLKQNLPKLCDAHNGQPHPAAVVAVLRIHARSGKDVELEEHVDEIRTAVSRWKERWA